MVADVVFQKSGRRIVMCRYVDENAHEALQLVSEVFRVDALGNDAWCEISDPEAEAQVLSEALLHFINGTCEATEK